MIRKAKVSDIKAIQALVNKHAANGAMLPLGISELYDKLRDFIVYEHDNKIVGVVALHFIWEGLAEIRSLAVDTDYQHQGIATSLVKRAIEDAREYGGSRVFALTYVPPFFEKNGFKEIDKAELPHKVWADCINCPKFPDCGEVPLALDL
ncbi:MAG: N-acetyltransferase [Planctomycetes bacterium]|nr:N-acetyltransferase [Planctomycetota bacterium]